MVLRRRSTATLVALALPTLSSEVVLAQGQPPAWPDQQPPQQYQQPPEQYQPPQQYQQQPQQYQQPGQYQPPPQQYQQYQQPGQYQQPQQYQPPQGYQQPGQYQQPPQYQPAPYPAGGGYPPPPPPPPPSGHRGFLVMGNLGVNAFLGASGQGLGPGFRFGGMFGYYFGPQFSVNLELMVDVLNFNSDTVAAQSGLHGIRGGFTISPLFHLPSGPNLELVLGPKLGGWSTTVADDFDDGYTYSGLLLGINAGLFVRAGSLYWGGLLTLENGSINSACTRYAGVDQDCGTVTATSSEKLLGFTGAILF